jgi:hypothetical protein
MEPILDAAFRKIIVACVILSLVAAAGSLSMATAAPPPQPRRYEVHFEMVN